jgi:predicted glycosyltransferase
MKSRPSLLLYCQHSLGMGHLMRSLALTRALAAEFRVTFVSGGRIPRNVRLDRDVRVVALPAVGIDGSGALVSHNRRLPLERALAERQRILLETFRAMAPDIMLVELFPFGRRKFRGELEPVLEAARRAPAERRTIVCCSVRDILVGRDRQREHDERAAALLERYFDAVLVHSDPAFARLEESLTPGIRLPVPLYYTGFVHDRRAIRPAREGRGRIVASAGGGMVGEDLFRTVLEAHARPEAAACPPLMIVAGPFLPERAWAALESKVNRRRRVTLRRAVRSLPAVLAGAAGSISQCGYNTAMDLVATGVPALVIPFTTAREDEQIKRARRLESLGALRLLAPEDATPRRVARAMAALRDFHPYPACLDLNGAERSARMLASFCASGLPLDAATRRHQEVPA